jgi:hypothetical protein
MLIHSQDHVLIEREMIMNVQTIETYVTEDDYSAYEIAKVLNKILSDSGVERTIKPQMMYNYARNGLIVRGEKIYGETLRRITKIEVVQFIVRYVERNKIELKIVDVNENQLVLFDV